MAFVVNDRVQETTSTIGTGSITLAGANTGFQSFSSGIGIGNETYYTINGDNQWEVGIGSLTNATTLTRTTVITSSNSNSLVNFSVGTKNVFCTLPASDATLVNTSNNVIVGNLNTSTALTTRSTSNLILNTNQGTNSGTISIANGVNGNISITPNGTGSDVIDGLNWPQADGTNGQFLQTNGTGTLSFATAGSPTIDTYNTSTGGTPTYVNSQVSVQNTAQTTIAATVPSGISNGNLLLMFVLSGSNASTWTTPSGWTLAVAGANGRGTFWRTASSEPASYTITQSGSATANAVILAYSNAAFDVAGTQSSALTTVTPPAITVAKSNSTIVYAIGASTSVATYTTPTGYTARASDSDATAPSASFFDLSGIGSGSYTAPSSTSSTGTCRAFAVAISPAGNTTWTKPTTANWIQINLWGGGGGGGRANQSVNNTGAGGGGGGGYNSVILPFSYFASTVTYIVGIGGAGGTVGEVGGTSSVTINNYNNTGLNKTLYAYGGGGAGFNDDTGNSGGGGGGGGIYVAGQTSPSGADTAGSGGGPGPGNNATIANGVFGGADGGGGGNAGQNSFYGGGGGGGGGAGVAGSNGGNSFYGGAGGGGASALGNGTGGTSVFGGNAGTAPGGGGTSGINSTGSSGAAGRVQFIYW
jgi:hypothetical protein